jgi:multicomponent Na+:H+ antiporter subunit C
LAFTTSSPIPIRCARFSLYNLIGSDVFLLLGIIARKGAAAACAADPVPQAMVITGIVVAFSASAIAITLVLRLFQETGRVTLRPDAFVKPPANGADNWYM